MLIRPSRRDVGLVVDQLGSVILVFGLTGVAPLTVAVAAREWDPAGWFLFMIGISVFAGTVLRAATPNYRLERLDRRHGLILIALVWLAAPMFAAVPLATSGHYGGWLDAYFDAMSGLTTTGLTVVQDVDHMAISLHVWRHLLQLIGGGGIAVAFLTLYPATGSVLYHSEARDVRFLPSAGSTARFIWRMTLAYAGVGIAALALVAATLLGFTPGRALFHAFTIFTAGFSTGGFAPMSTSIAYYHSLAFEVVVDVIMLAGATNFALHFAIWERHPRWLRRDLELRTYLGVFVATTITFLIGLVVADSFRTPAALLRQGMFQAISAQTTTGFSTISVSRFASLGGLAFAGIVTAMALGSMSMSTGGGVKAVRVGVTLKAIAHVVRSELPPRQAVVASRWQQAGETRRLTPDVTVGVMSLSLLFVGLYLLGAALGIAYGYPLDQALFESVSAAGTVGLSAGITAPGMPALLQLVYTFSMWAGRLEFIAVISLLAYLVSLIRGE